MSNYGPDRGATTLSIISVCIVIGSKMTISIMTASKMTASKTTASIMTGSIKAPA
jgi:hypothetical protein